MSRPRLVTLAALAAVLALYVATAARCALGGDSAELATVGAEGGAPHPSGYPLYVLWLRAFAWLPAASPAHRGALATALLGVLAMGAAYVAARRWGADRAGALAAATGLATSTLPWIMATHPEVFAMNAALCLAIVAAAAPEAPLRGTPRVALLAGLAGLALANHMTAVLLAPLGLFAVVQAFRREGARAAAVPLALGALVVGLSPYAYFAVVGRDPGDRWAWGELATAGGVLNHALRVDYGTFSHSVRGERAPLAQLGQLALSLGRAWALVGLPLALVGAVKLAREQARRGAFAALVASFFLAGPLFVAWSNVPLAGPGLLVEQRFHLLPMVLLVVPVARGISAARAAVARFALVDALAATLVAGQVLVGLAEVREHHRPTIENWARNVLASAPPRAIILGSGDQRTFPVLYAQRALGLRRDVAYVDVWLLHHPWYRRRAARELGFAPDEPVNGSVDTVALAMRALGTGRALLMTDMFSPGIPSRFPMHPFGPIMRVMPPRAALPDVATIEREQAELEASYAREEEPPARGSWAEGLIDLQARGWVALGDAWGRVGDPASRARCRARAAAWAPWVVGTP